VIGAKQRGKRRAIIETLKDHKKTTIQAFIRRNILPGTSVFSDGHKSYVGLEKMKGINPPYKVIFFLSYLPNPFSFRKARKVIFATQFKTTFLVIIKIRTFFHFFQHGSVNHSTNYVDPITGVNTNSIEREWKEMKQKWKRMCGVAGSQRESYIADYLWRQANGIPANESAIKTMDNLILQVVDQTLMLPSQ
jgi:hypothetical protein